MTDLTDGRISEILALAWDDETSFDAIKAQTGLSESEVIEIMRRNMKPSSFRMWRKRVSGRASKHDAKIRRSGNSRIRFDDGDED
ncbi:MAG: TIGR03643 family protein [Pseudomonadota bacterium]